MTFGYGTKVDLRDVRFPAVGAIPVIITPAALESTSPL